MSLPISRRLALGLLPLSAVAASLLAVSARWHPGHSAAHPRLVYTAQGYGGFVTASPVGSEKVVLGPLAALRQQYRDGRYQEVETEAEPLVKQAFQARQEGPLAPIEGVLKQGASLDSALPPSMEAVQAARQAVPTPRYITVRRGAEAELISAYSAARRGEFRLAESRFQTTREMASYLPDHGAVPPHLGEPEPGLEEEAAFQQIVCVSAEGEKAKAEAGYRYFIQTYPLSILIHAAAKRIARLHGGDLPKSAEAVWKTAMKQQAKVQKERQREASLCAPECLAHLLQAQGRKVEVERLAYEMKTDENGTTLSALTATAAKHGYHPQGLRLKWKGLEAQKLPVVALVHGAHFVVVEQVTPQSVTVWNPDAKGVGKGAEQTAPATQWQKEWQGVTMALK